MSQWNTQYMLTELRSITKVKSAEVVSAGEGCTTEQIRVEIKGTEEAAFVRGFVTDGHLTADDNVNVEMVEVATNYSDGDIPNDAVFCEAYGYIRAAVIRRGHQAVNSMRSYF